MVHIMKRRRQPFSTETVPCGQLLLCGYVVVLQPGTVRPSQNTGPVERITGRCFWLRFPMNIDEARYKLTKVLDGARG